jgi:hypothetical protein
MIAVVVAILIAVLIAMVASIRDRQTPLQKSKRKLKMREGDITAIGDIDRDVPLHFAGKGTWSSKPIPLEPGDYRLGYQFSSGVPVRVGLVSSFDGEDETLLIKSGNGVEGFAVDANGRYILEVQPADEATEWQIVFQHVSRYGAAREADDELTENGDEDEGRLRM